MKFNLLFTIVAFTSPLFCLAQVPILNSNPSVTNKVIYLDFDGQVVTGTSWNGGNTINAAPSTISNANKIVVFKRISEDYAPFEVNVTTDSMRFKNATPNRRIRIIFTPTSAWYGSAGGVAYLNSFTWGGYPGTPCWVFENQLGYNPKSMAEAASHEGGHTLSLRHQSTYNSSCAKTNEYNPGLGSGVTSWAPIMGVGYSKNVTIWHNGKSATSCNTTQFDHGSGSIGITGPNFLSFKADDIGGTFATAKILNLNTVTTIDSGLISQPTDLDAFRFTICQNRYVSIAVKPWALDTTNYSGANLDVRLHVYNASNSLIAVDTTLTKLHTLVGLNLAPGSYYFTVDGGRSNYYSDYGSLGRYYVSIKATNPPAIANTILLNTSICEGQSATLSSSATGVPASWEWTVSGTSSTSTFVIQNPTMVFAPAGVYTLSLLAYNGSSTSCPVTNTLLVGAAPSLTVAGNNGVLCPPASATLTASGAMTYTWLPGNLTASVNAVNPSATTSYTLRGGNGSCTGSVVTTVTVNPSFTIVANASKNTLCPGESVILTLSGANSYTVNPGSFNTPTTVLSPTISTNYLVFGSVGPCIKAVSRSITVAPDFTFTASADKDFLCVGEEVVITSSGANSYTVIPGNVTANPATLHPTANTTYTVLGSMQPPCNKEIQLPIIVEACDTGIEDGQAGTGFGLYPNPVHSALHIVITEGRLQVTISNALGQQVHRVMLGKGDNVVDISGWPRGIYFVEAAQTGIRKLVIE